MDYQFNFRGLTNTEVKESRARFGMNTLEKSNSHYWPVIREIITEPMFLLLLVAASIYFISGEVQEGLVLTAAILIVSGISLFQESRSRKALEALKKYTEPKASVLRENKVISIPSEEIVVGDYVVVEEGSLIPADGTIVQCNDFSVNESILTGESFPVVKESLEGDNQLVYQGTLVSSGLALFKASATGMQTRFGKIGKSLEEIREEKTPLQVQIESFVKGMAFVGIIVFLVIWGYNYYLSNSITDSLLKGLTLAMSILPEEIPVAFTTFMALGAWRLMKKGIIVKQIKTVESLGSATVICVDKTGTLTENKMQLARMYDHSSSSTVEPGVPLNESQGKLLEYAMWASEPVPFDPMERALHEAYAKNTAPDVRSTTPMIHEYPLSGKPPMMTHVFRSTEGKIIIAAKGAPEIILKLSTLTEETRNRLNAVWTKMASEGFRVLGVAKGEGKEDALPNEQQQFPFEFLGFVSFYDPPKKNIAAVFQQFKNAGIKVKVITGDNAMTTAAVVRAINFETQGKALDGEELLRMSDDELNLKIENTNLFTRMFPEAKLRIINSLKNRNHIVAMTGDGVNDGPALKAAHIGIAMGNRGSEIAKQASSLILSDDDLSRMLEAIAMGRKIYTNLKKAIQYIIAIHIPIILTVSIPLLAGWLYPAIFTPIHVIFLELIMGPTCSVVFENEPMEKYGMQQPPRKLSNTFLKWHELRISILQGLVITAGTLGVYQYAVYNGWDEVLTRSVVFTTLIFANIFLTFASRSMQYSLYRSVIIPNQLMRYMILISLGTLALILYVPQVQNIFAVQGLSISQLAISLGFAFASVAWFDLYKLTVQNQRPG